MVGVLDDDPVVDIIVSEYPRNERFIARPTILHEWCGYRAHRISAGQNVFADDPRREHVPDLVVVIPGEIDPSPGEVRQSLFGYRLLHPGVQRLDELPES